MTPKDLLVYIIYTIPFVLLIELTANIGVLTIATVNKFLFPNAWAPAWFVSGVGFVIAASYGTMFVIMDAKNVRRN